MIAVYLFVAYLIVGYCCHYFLFPEKRPRLDGYFKPGHSFRSKAEGAVQTIVRHNDGIVYMHAALDPFAPGPPKHIHYDFDETFAIANGELSIWMAGEIKKIRPGDRLLIPKGVAHKPFNHTADRIEVDGLVPFPERFAFGLCQVYGLVDARPWIANSPRMALQMALFHNAGFDATLAEGPPPFVQKLSCFLLVPLAGCLATKAIIPSSIRNRWQPRKETRYYRERFPYKYDNGSRSASLNMLSGATVSRTRRLEAAHAIDRRRRPRAEGQQGDRD